MPVLQFQRDQKVYKKDFSTFLEAWECAREMFKVKKSPFTGIQILRNPGESPSAISQLGTIWVSYGDAARYLGIRYQQIYQAVEAGHLQPIIQRGKKRLRLGDVINWRAMRR